ncbi:MULTISPECIES: hypothetical protein [Dethiosulfovibrio]|uniref:DUF2993 domain-containing protein n=2 Tax=Dethiosulfovibrio TaxID=47054 RepID=A0ABS9EP14_9BACT|nr:MULTISPECIES: hypothetical protein [Dethiosulfovibrio]MCF4114413.1 hypothetical protein [Dethiosulfovibrio russensis]MCF4142926.1 hypothetical protein [Dethiosulfovibrio marinus]MCF4145023.1 hypothetical protein [Dethiosulfovibrio acidaminovorans]
MKSRFSIAGIVLLTAVLLLSATAHADTRPFVGDIEGSAPEVRLFRWLVDRVSPESALMVLDGPIEKDGKVRHLYFEAIGPSLDGFKVASVKVETVFNDFGPLESWGDGGPADVDEIVMGYFDAVITDSDVNDFLKGLVVEDDSGRWEGLSVEFSPSGISAKGYYRVEDPVSLRVKVDLQGELTLKEGREIWIDRYMFKINNDDQSSVVEKALKDVQPIVDMEDFVFPVHLKTLDLRKGRMRLATRVIPAPFDGISLSYKAR